MVRQLRRQGFKPTPPPTNPLAAMLTPEAIEAAREAADRRAAEQAEERAQKYQRLVASIPPALRDTDEARLMLQRVTMSWDVPIHPNQAKAWSAEWEAFVRANTAVARVRAGGLWLPGDD